MKPLLSARELARRSYESVAVHTAYEKRRKLRQLLGKKSKRSAKQLDDLDPPSLPGRNDGAASWQAAEREARPARRGILSAEEGVCATAGDLISSGDCATLPT